MAKNIKELGQELEEEIEELNISKVPRNRKKIISLCLWIAFAIVMVLLAIKFRWDKFLGGSLVFLIGILSQGIQMLLGTISVVPGIGPLITKFFAIPLVLLVNGLGNLLTFFAIKMGYRREVIDAKMLSITFMVGLLMGFVIAEMIK